MMAKAWAWPLLACGALAAAQAAPQRWTPAALSTDQYESSPTFSPDGREVVFMRADRSFQHYRLLWSRCESGRWTEPQAPPFAAPTPALEADPFFTPDGRQLYFVSNRQAPRDEDNLDIWVVSRDANGSWGTPRRLPEPVNSPASELLPRLDAQGRLWFGSDRPGGWGQGDIYVATPGAGHAWGVANAGPRTMLVVADRGDRSHLYRYTRGADGRWAEQGRVDARPDVFQVGPLLSPRGERLLFAQADGEASGEWFVVDLVPGSSEPWPPTCPTP